MEDWVSEEVFSNHIEEMWVQLPICGVDLSDSEAKGHVFQPIAKLPSCFVLIYRVAKHWMLQALQPF